MKGSAAKKSPAASSHKQEETNGVKNEVSSHEKLLRDQPELLQQFGMDLLPVLTQVRGLSAPLHLFFPLHFNT